MMLEVKVDGVPDRCLEGCYLALIPERVSYRKADGLVKSAKIRAVWIARYDDEKEGQ